jgi:hypothetical protein
MNMNNRTTIKILGSVASVKATATKIESLFPLYIEGSIRLNDNSDGVHIIITVPAVENEEYDILDGLKRARQAAEKENKNVLGLPHQEITENNPTRTKPLLEAVHI